MAPELKRLEATVHGVVQGVGYRWYARQMARRLNLSGYVRNRYDRTVEVVAEGRERSLRAFLADLERGPSAAVVERVDASWLPADSSFHSFEVRF
jgi:acylphosphatase